MSIRKSKIFNFIVCVVLVLSNITVVMAENIPAYDSNLFPVSGGEYSYNVCTTMYSVKDGEKYQYISNYMTFDGDSEVVAFQYQVNDNLVAYGYISKLFFDVKNLSESMVLSTEKISRNTYSNNSSILSVDGVNYYSMGWNIQGNLVNPYDNTFTDSFNTMLTFKNRESAINYLETGSLDGLLKGRSNVYDSDNIYLENFRAVYHDSNSLEQCYVEVSYSLPSYVEEHIEEAYLNVNCIFDIDYEIMHGVLDVNALDINASEQFALSTYPTGFKFYITDYIGCDPDIAYSEVIEYLIYNAVLGDEAVFDFSGIGLDYVIEITNSKMYMGIVPCINMNCGMSYDATINFLNPALSSYHSSTPDSQGNYTPNGDYTQTDGYYTTVVGTDSQGNNTYNYYYYDNSTHQTTEITDNSVDGGGGGISQFPKQLTLAFATPLVLEGVNIDNSSNSSSGGSSSGSSDIPELIIEDDDYTDSSLREDLRDGFGLLDNMDTEQNGDGFLQMTAGFFEHLDGELDDILIFGMSSVVAISILRAVFRR